MSTTYETGSTLGVLARQEIRNYLRHKLFWFGTALTLLISVDVLFSLDHDAGALGAIGLSAYPYRISKITLFFNSNTLKTR